MTEPGTQPTPPQPDPSGEPVRDPNAEAAAETKAESTTNETSTEEAAEVATGVAATPEGEAAREVAATVTTAEAIAAADTAALERATAVTPAAIAAAAPAATAAAETSAAAETPAVADTPAAEAGPSRRSAARRVLRQLGVVVLTVGLFVGGIALGTYLFQTTRAAPAGGGTGVVVNSEGPPPVAQEFISALGRNDADALRSSLDQEPHLDLTREMTKFGIQRVDNVEVLGTHVDGDRSATEILMQYESTDGTPFAINLVILVDSGKIEGFR